jgi:antitoxin (DNA-binding transcriptional repressor) of toxin-antitoxin stability system
MTRTVNVHEAKTHLSELLRLVEAGEDVIIARAGKPVARLVVETGAQARKSVIGAMEGQIWISEDFAEPMPPEWLEQFYGGKVEMPRAKEATA